MYHYTPTVTPTVNTTVRLVILWLFLLLPHGCSPVLMTLSMTFATWPFRREFSTLTISSRQVHSTIRELANRMSPTARSDNPESTNRCRPVETRRRNKRGKWRQNIGINGHRCIQIRGEKDMQKQPGQWFMINDWIANINDCFILCIN